VGPVVRRLSALHGPGVESVAAHAAESTEIYWVPAGRAAHDVIAAVPSIHMAWCGRYPLQIDGRALRLEDEVFLVVNAGHTISARARRDPAASLLCIYFTPELLDRALAELTGEQRELIDGGTHGGSARLFEHVREQDGSIASVMRYIAHHLCAGVDDALWYEEQIGFLLRRLLLNEVQIVKRINGKAHSAKAWKRRETFGRLTRVTDLIHSAYERPLAITELAAAAHWSVFHMMREFKALYEVTPFEFLQRRRIQAAARLLCSTDLSVAQIAERVGFHERSTMMRRLRRSLGMSARALRVSSPQQQQSSQRMPHRTASAASSRVNSATSIFNVR
jgi:AraC family transcriptional regulator